MEDQNGFTIVLPDLRIMFPGKERTPTDHYRYSAGKWMIAAGLDPYKEKDRHAFRDAVLNSLPEDWRTAPQLETMIRMIRAWNPSLASIERPATQDAKFSLFSGPPVPPLPPMTKHERDLTREIISSAMQLRGKRKGE